MATTKKRKSKKSKGLKASTALITTEGAKRAATSTANYAKNNTQTLLVLAAVAVGGYILYKALNKVDKASDVIDEVLTPGSGSGSGGTTTGGNTPPPVNSGLTITENQASGIARVLLTAMDGFGTSTSKIYEALRGKTPADYHLISEAFGTPRYDGAGEGMWPAPQRGLTDWITRELSQNEMNELRKVIPNVF